MNEHVVISNSVVPNPVRDGGATRSRVPGEPGIWVFILADMTTFSAFFVMFALYRRNNPHAASLGHAHLHTSLALINTVLLLIGSYLVVVALAKLRTNPSLSSKLFWATGATGIVFALNKFYEYYELATGGYTLTSHEYFTYYYAITGLHLIHVFIGVTIVFVLAACATRAPWTPRRALMFENGCSYWHMVDLLWLVILPLFYILT